MADIRHVLDAVRKISGVEFLGKVTGEIVVRIAPTLHCSRNRRRDQQGRANADHQRPGHIAQ